MTITTVALLILIPLLVWRIYSRLRLLFARQRSVLWKHWAGALGVPFMLLAAASSMTADTLALSLMGCAALAGGWIAAFSLKKTRFENTGKAFYFTPHFRSGMVVCMLFAARVIQIGVELYLNRQSDLPHPISRADVMQHPATVISFGLMAGYVALYSIGMLRWRLAQKPLPTEE
jgi:hypothetical protein